MSSGVTCQFTNTWYVYERMKLNLFLEYNEHAAKLLLL